MVTIIRRSTLIPLATDITFCPVQLLVRLLELQCLCTTITTPPPCTYAYSSSNAVLRFLEAEAKAHNRRTLQTRYVIGTDPHVKRKESVRVVSLQVQVNDNQHGVFVRTYREGLCYRRRRYHCITLHRKDENRRGQDQDSQSSPSNGILWRVRFVHAHPITLLPKKD